MSCYISNHYLPKAARQLVGEFLDRDTREDLPIVSKNFAKNVIPPEKDIPILTDKIVRKQLNDKLVESMRSITRDYQERYSTTDINKRLRGIHYPKNYAQLVLEANRTDLFNFFNKRNSFFHGYLHYKFFRMIDDRESPSGKKVNCHIIKDGADPVKALRSVRNGPSLMGCGECCQLAQYEAILHLVGPKRFRVCFSATSKTPLAFGPIDENPIGRLRQYLIQKDFPSSSICKGDQLYIENIKEYRKKHLIGDTSGFNVICSVPGINPKFLALAQLEEDPTSEGVGYEQIKEVLIISYNDSFSCLNNYSDTLRKKILAAAPHQSLERSKKLKKSKIDEHKFTQLGGGQTTLLCELHVKRIALIANSPIKSGPRYLAKFKPGVEKRSITIQEGANPDADDILKK